MCSFLHYPNSHPSTFIANPGAVTGSNNVLKVLISGYNSEIGVYNVQPGSYINPHTLLKEKSWAVDPNLSWITQVDDSFYAIHEVSEFNNKSGGGISRWQIENGDLVKRENLNLKSTGPAHVLVDKENNVAIASNYGGGSISVVSLKAGHLMEVVQVLSYGEGCRDKSHPHQAVKQGDFYYVVDLGCDAIYTFRMSEGKLEQLKSTSVEAGCGPRHIVFSGIPAGSLGAVVCEQSNHVLTFDVHKSGELTFKQKIDFATTEGDYGAEILSHNGYIYASSRGKGVIVVYKIVYNNQLQRIQEFKVNGTWPRSIAIKDNILLAADQRGDSVQIITIQPYTGFLFAGGSLKTPPGPAFVMFYD